MPNGNTYNLPRPQGSYAFQFHPKAPAVPYGRHLDLQRIGLKQYLEQAIRPDMQRPSV